MRKRGPNLPSGSTWSSWEAYSTSKTWTLASADGTQTVSVQFRDTLGNVSDVLSDTILLSPLVPEPAFVRGDPNGDGWLDISDSVTILLYLFDAGLLGCQDSADADDTGTVDITDAILLLNHLFLAGSPPSAPTGACGVDPTEDALTCDEYTDCGL